MEIKKVKIKEIKNHPANARVGDIDSLIDSLDAHGQYKPLLVQKSTGYILAGNHTYKALKEMGTEQVDVIFLDVSDTKAKEIMLIDNKTSDNAEYDDKKLYDLLNSEGIDITATGYDYNEYERLKENYENRAEAIPIIDTKELEQLQAKLTPEIEKSKEPGELKIEIDPEKLKNTLAKLTLLEPERMSKGEFNGKIITAIKL